MLSSKIRFICQVAMCLFSIMIPAFLYLEMQKLKIQENELSDKNHFGGHDWVSWGEGPEGLVAETVHPMGRKLEEETRDYVRPGDVLKKLDYIPGSVTQLKTLQRIVRNSPPGKVFIYQLKRKGPGDGNPEVLNLFIRNSYLPIFIPAYSNAAWNASYWILSLMGFGCLVAFLIVLPLLRPQLQENMPKLLVIISSFFIFGLLLTRQVFLFASTNLADPSQEKVFLPMFFILMNIIAVFYFLSLAKRKQKLFGIIPFVASVALVVMLIQAIRSGHFWLYQGPVSIAEMGFCILMLTSTLLISISIKWKERSITDKIFTSSALLLFGILGFGLLASRIDGTAGKTPGDWWILLFFVAIAVAPASLTAGELKFGKVNVVLTQSLFYLGLSILVLLLYSLIHEVFFYFGLSFRYQVLAEISVLVAIVILLRNIYNAFEDRVKKFFTLSQQKRLDELNRFVSSIPRYTSSEKLLEDLENKLTGFFKASYVIAGTKVSGGPGTDELNALGKALIHPEDFWSKNKQLSANLLPEPYESGLQKSPLALAFPLRTKDQDGFLLLGRKKRGVYNLSDLELMGRILQQTRLTLEVLALVEREKLLLEKNYEANLTALRSQINPHFLFNTLNTISSLIHDAPTDAENAIEKLAYIFRYTMRTSGSKFVQLEDEMSLVKTYLEIEKFRFGNRIELHFDFDQDVLDTSIPGLVIQTVVENCIKHGVAKIMGVGTISIIISKNGNNAQVVVEDNGPGIDVSRIHSSTGLNNILTRMKEIYRKENLIYFENTGKGTRVTIQIPLNHE